MKKACNKFRKFCFLFLFACLYFFNTSCGLDTLIVMYDPATTVNVPEYDNIQFQENYFQFETKEYEYSGLKFLGTEIYYKIYNNYLELETERSRLQSLANDDETSLNSANTLTETLKYQPLRATLYKEEPLIPAADPVSNQMVYIRLTDYQNLEEFAAKITINGENLSGTENKSQPVRKEGNTFNFGRNGTDDKVPVENDDADYKKGEFTKDNTFYVCMFAVGVGVDAAYAPHYSNITYLGTVPIDSSTVDN